MSEYHQIPAYDARVEAAARRTKFVNVPHFIESYLEMYAMFAQCMAQDVEAQVMPSGDPKAPPFELMTDMAIAMESAHRIATRSLEHGLAKWRVWGDCRVYRDAHLGREHVRDPLVLEQPTYHCSKTGKTKRRRHPKGVWSLAMRLHNRRVAALEYDAPYIATAHTAERWTYEVDRVLERVLRRKKMIRGPAFDPERERKCALDALELHDAE